MIRIITDSTSDITPALADRLGVTVVPLKVIFGEEALREGVDISMEEFYDRLPKAQSLPTTSQPAPNEFCAQFLNAKEAGDSVVVMTISSHLSGTYQSATIGKEMAEYDDVYIIDSLTASIGLRLLVDEALRLRDAGGLSAAEIAEVLTELRDRVRLFALVDTLEYLHKGGRLSSAGKIAGTLLNFKPIISLRDGVISAVGKARGTANGIDKMLEEVAATGEIDTRLPTYFGYTALDDKGLQCRDKAVDGLTLADTLLCPVGCVIGTHVGPGACIVSYAVRA